MADRLTPIPLTPAEAFVLLDPKRSNALEAFKIAFLSLVAQRVLTMRMVEQRGWGRHRNVPVVAVAREAPGSVLAADIVAIVRKARPSAEGIELRAVATVAAKVFGAGLFKLKTEHVLPALTRRGLLASRRVWVLLIFPWTRYDFTDAGVAEKQRIEMLLDRARELPLLLQSDPAEAKAVVLAAGGLLLLVPELKPLYGQLATLGALPSTGADSSDAVSWEGMHSMSGVDVHHGAHADAGGFDAGSWDFGGFETGGFDVDFGAFDAGFDASFSDGGGDGGGGGHGGH